MDRLDPFKQESREPRPLSSEAVTEILQAIPPSNLRDRTLFGACGAMEQKSGVRENSTKSRRCTHLFSSSALPSSKTSLQLFVRSIYCP